MEKRKDLQRRLEDSESANSAHAALKDEAQHLEKRCLHLQVCLQLQWRHWHIHGIIGMPDGLAGVSISNGSARSG